MISCILSVASPPALMYNFAEMDEREKAQALGSINAAFGATVIIPVIDIPIADSIIFSQDSNVNKNLNVVKKLNMMERNIKSYVKAIMVKHVL